METEAQQTAAKASQQSSQRRSSKSDFSPKCCFVSYPDLIDLCVCQLVSFFQDSFVEKDGRFVLAKKLSKKKLKTLLLSFLSESMSKIVADTSSKNPCFKNVKFVAADSGVRRRAGFEQKEKDLDFGFEQAAAVLEEEFVSCFFGKSELSLPGKWVFCKHDFLLADEWKKVCEKVFGKKNCFDSSLKREKKSLEEIVANEEIAFFSKKENKILLEETTAWLSAKL